MKKLVVAVWLLMGIAACSDESPVLSQKMDNEVSRAEVTDISVTVGKGSVDGLHLSYLPGGSRISFWTVDGTSGIYDHSGTGLDMVSLTAEGEGSSQVWRGNGEIQAADKAMAFYPHDGSITDYTSIPVSYGTTDYLYSGFVLPVGGKWLVHFNHVLTGLRVVMEKNGYTGTGSVASVTLQSQSLTDKGRVDASTGIVAAEGKGGVLSYPQKLNMSTALTSVDLLAVPTGVVDDLSVNFRVDGKDYEISVPMDKPMSQERLVFLHVCLTDKGMMVRRQGSCEWDSVLDSENYSMDGMGDDEYAVSVGHVSDYGQGGLYVANVMGFVGMVDWGDGWVEEFDRPVDNPQHVYEEGRNYIVRFKGRAASLNNLVPVLPTTGCEYMIDRILNIGGDLGITNMSVAFMQSDIDFLDGSEFRHIAGVVTSFNKVFMDCTGLTELPGNLFEGCSSAETFKYAFTGCTGLTELPEQLFEDCVRVTDFSAAFADCISLVSIPEGLFASNSEVREFGSLDMEYKWSGVFAGCTSLTEIPENLFASCGKVQSFYSAFRGCSSLKNIPENLFASNPEVVNFSNVFYGCGGLTGIPGRLFAGNGKVTDFSYSFQGCTGLTALPEELFRKGTDVLNFAGTFASTSLKTIPAGLFDSCRKVKDFRATFGECEHLTGESPYTMIKQTKVHLYERSLYPDEFAKPEDYDYCFWYGSGLSDYENIPLEWK